MTKKPIYSASFTAASMMYYETNSVLPLMMSDNADELINQELDQNELMKINSYSSRKRVIHELKKRYKAVSRNFWEYYLTLPESTQRIYLYYVILKAYPLMMYFHEKVAMQQWNSIDRRITTEDVRFALVELSATDEKVDSWTDITKKKIISSYINILSQAGMLNKKTGEIIPARLPEEEINHLITTGEEWYLRACFLNPSDIEKIKEGKQ